MLDDAATGGNDGDTSLTGGVVTGMAGVVRRLAFSPGGGTPVAPSWMTEVAQIHRLSTGVAAAEDSAAALDDACSCKSSSNPAAIFRNKSNSIATGVLSGAAAVLVVEVLDSFEVGDVASTATGALVGTSVGCVCSSLDWLVVVAGSGGNVGETKVAAGVVAGAPST